MINRNNIASGSLAALALFAFSAPAVAGFYEMAPSRDVDLCISEIQGSADYTGAGRVRHEVESNKRRTVGYSLAIDTTVYSEIDGLPIRAYKAICVVTGGRKPLEFSIQETGDGA